MLPLQLDGVTTLLTLSVLVLSVSLMCLLCSALPCVVALGWHELSEPHSDRCKIWHPSVLVLSIRLLCWPCAALPCVAALQGALPAKEETLPQGSAKLEYWPLAAIVSAPDAKVRLGALTCICCSHCCAVPLTERALHRMPWHSIC
jgi:hypothetical protein